MLSSDDDPAAPLAATPALDAPSPLPVAPSPAAASLNPLVDSDEDPAAASAASLALAVAPPLVAAAVTAASALAAGALAAVSVPPAASFAAAASFLDSADPFFAALGGAGAAAGGNDCTCVALPGSVAARCAGRSPEVRVCWPGFLVSPPSSATPLPDRRERYQSNPQTRCGFVSDRVASFGCQLTAFPSGEAEHDSSCDAGKLQRDTPVSARRVLAAVERRTSRLGASCCPRRSAVVDRSVLIRSAFFQRELPNRRDDLLSFLER